MLKVCRAEEGEILEVATTLWDLEAEGDLERALQKNTGISEDAIIAYLPDGRRLTTENIRELAGTTEDTIYIFNKRYLEYDLHEVLRELRIQPQLQPPIEDSISSTPPFRPHQLAAAYHHIAQIHTDEVSRIVNAIGQQSSALNIASRNLDLNILALSEAFEPFTLGAQNTFEAQSRLLNSLEADLAAVAAVKIHPTFLSPAARRAIENGDKARTLGDYVANDKMRQVADGCARISDGLRIRFERAQECMARLVEGSDQIRVTLQSNHILTGAESGDRKARDAYERVNDIASRINTANADSLLPELKQADMILRKEVESIVDTKNLSTELCIGALRRISVLNADLVQLPGLMTELQSDLRAKTSFVHIQRLHNMLYAYGATLIEIVRRKEFARFFYQRAQSILEVMAKLTAAEKRRRQIYRGEVHGQLPFDTKGMDESVPSIDFTPSGGKESESELAYPLERSDVNTFMHVLNDLDLKLHSSTQPFLETRNSLEKLIERMDGIEGSFDKIVERSLISNSRMSMSRRRFNDADEVAFRELSERVVSLERDKEESENILHSVREDYERHIAHLQDQAGDTADEKQNRIEALTAEVRSLRAQNDAEGRARKVLEDRHSELLSDVEALRKGQAEALADATSHAQEAEALRLDLSQTRKDFEEAKELENAHADRVSQLLAAQTEMLSKLSEAQKRGEDLRSQIESARTDNASANRALREVSEQKEKLLRAQAQEHDRIIRDHIAEADGDRAVLEKRFFEARAQLEEQGRALKEAKSEVEVLSADVVGLREELQRTEHQLEEARHNEQVFKNDFLNGRASQSDFEQRIGERDRLIAQVLDVAIAFHDCHSKAFAALQPLSVHPATALKNNVNPSESIVLSPPRLPMSPLRENTTPIDPTEPAAALEILRGYDLDAFSDTVTKVGGVVRKWQKQCREYRERSKSKITFRNFAKGDLALFLPTRNSVSKPWAAFNVSFPHYFLNATGRLAEQLKTREWIVARITSISERIVDPKDPESNPYGLGDGIKYYMLEVEDWTKPGGDPSKRRRSSNRHNQEPLSSSPPLERPISPPLPNDSQAGSSAAEPLGPTRSPNSHLFPVRSRSNSASAGPSSLSKLLASASPADISTSLETIPATPPFPSRSRTPSPVSRFSNVPPPSPTRAVNVAHSPNMPSPLRPGSRASSTSRVSFSGGRIAPFGKGANPTATPKATATTALSSETQVNNSPPSSLGGHHKTGSLSGDHKRFSSGPVRSSSPSPAQSASEGMSNLVSSRRRTTSEHVSPSTLIKIRKPTTANAGPSSSASSALASLASTLGMSMIGRRRKTAPPETQAAPQSEDDADMERQPFPSSHAVDDSVSSVNSRSSRSRLSAYAASDLLKQLDNQ